MVARMESSASEVRGAGAAVGVRPGRRREVGVPAAAPATLLPGVSVVLPCFDEAENVAEAIRAAIEAGAASAERCEIVVVDDGSSDGTGRIAAACAAADPRVRIVAHERNRGYGEALRSGLQAASMPWILLTDADLQFDLGQLAELVPLTAEADLIVGRRVQRRDPAIRRLNAGLWNRLVRSRFRLPVRDVDCAFKLVRAEYVRDVELRARGALISTELVVRAVAAGARVRELGVRHLPRTAGEQSGANPRVVARAFRELVQMHGELRTLAVGPTVERRRTGLGPRLVAAAPIVLVLAAAAALRLWSFAGVGGNAFYDAAVRSMSLSWHNLFFGAFDPTGMAAIDKAPVDLWLQVASVKLLGFGTVALRLPEALGGIAAVWLLYGLGRRLFGRAAGLAAAAALAVLPASVLTGRSDTMDSLMSALTVLAAWLVVRAAQSPERRVRWLIAGGAALGLAFNVKLSEALIPLPAIALLGWIALEGPARRRLAALGAGGAAFLLVACSWLVAVTLAPGPKPFPIGSQDGTAWNVVVVFDGLARLGLTTTNGPQPRAGGAGPLVLFGAGGARMGAMIGGELVVALLAGGVALALARGPRRTRLQRAGIAFTACWLLTGMAVFSLTGGLRTRYLEALAPAVALALGAGVTALARAATGASARARRAALAALAVTIVGAAGYAIPSAHPPRAALIGAGVAALLVCLAPLARSVRPLRAGLLVVALAGLLAIPTITAVRIAGHHASDAGNPGGMPLAEVARIDRYLTSHGGGARYAYAVTAAAKAGPLIVADPRPVLVLTTAYGIPLTSAHRLAADVRAGQVRYALMGGSPCRPGAVHATGCAPAVMWARAHGTDVSIAAGAYHHGMLLRLRA
jgi:4-amino-4-deoxy-L-arabinose transferase-like glycosyltransferase